MKYLAAFAEQPKPLIVAEMACLTAGIGIVDFFTKWEVSLFVLYGIPIFAASWLASRRAGFGIAVLAGLVWFVANLRDHPYLTMEGYTWAAINRLFYFGFVAIGGTAMRHQREENRKRIEALTLARELELEIVRAGEREQIRIGQDLHDGVCQNLAAIDCATASLKKALDADGSPQAALVGKIQEYLKETIVEARNLARGIYPVQVENDGLVSALGELATKANFIREGSVHFEGAGDIRIEDPQIALHLYRIAQEAISNATRHANASLVTLSLSQEESNLVMRISDDGKGFDAEKNLLEGIGLRTMEYRAQLIGASLTIWSTPGEGATVECVMPSPADIASPALVSHSS